MDKISYLSLDRRKDMCFQTSATETSERRQGFNIDKPKVEIDIILWIN